MLKNKYQRMNEQEKKETLESYKETKEGQVMLKKLLKVYLSGIFCCGYALFFFIDTYKTSKNIWGYAFAGLILFAGLVFVIFYYHLKVKNLNHYAIKNQS